MQEAEIESQSSHASVYIKRHPLQFHSVNLFYLQGENLSCRLIYQNKHDYFYHIHNINHKIAHQCFEGSGFKLGPSYSSNFSYIIIFITAWRYEALCLMLAYCDQARKKSDLQLVCQCNINSMKKCRSIPGNNFPITMAESLKVHNRLRHGQNIHQL